MIFFIAAGMDQNRRVTGDFIQIAKVNCYEVIFTHTDVITSIFTGKALGFTEIVTCSESQSWSVKGQD